jgi:hypothetical protein
MSGELPANQISRLPGGLRYKELILNGLRNKKLVHTYYRDKLRGHRLTAKAKKLLLAGNPTRFGFFLTGNADTNTPKSEITRRIRLHRISETYVTMLNAGIPIYRDNKTDVFYHDGLTVLPESEIVLPAFYNSREIKEIGVRSTAVRGARMTGALLTDTAAYVVYNAGDGLIKWNYKSEMRAKALLTALLCRERLPGIYESDNIKALIFGNGMDTAFQLMTSTGGVKRSYFILDGSYDSFLYLTNDHAGETVLRIVCDVTLTNELDRILFENLNPRTPGLLVEHDAIDETGNPVLFGYSFDMPRIIRFDSALRLYNRTGTLICFDFQTGALRRYCSDNVSLQAIDLNKLEKRFFI